MAIKMGNWGRTLPKTNSSPMKMDGWKTFSFPFGALCLFSEAKL